MRDPARLNVYGQRALDIVDALLISADALEPEELARSGKTVVEKTTSLKRGGSGCKLPVVFSHEAKMSLSTMKGCVASLQDNGAVQVLDRWLSLRSSSVAEALAGYDVVEGLEGELDFDIVETVVAKRIDDEAVSGEILRETRRLSVSAEDLLTIRSALLSECPTVQVAKHGAEQVMKNAGLPMLDPAKIEEEARAREAKKSRMAALAKKLDARLEAAVGLRRAAVAEASRVCAAASADAEI